MGPSIHLTPKGPLVPMGDKPILGCVVWPHTIFRFFESFCKDASRNKLHISANIMILGATVQKLWMFEVFRWTLGRAGMCWNQPARVDHLRKKWKARQKKNSKKEGQANPVQALTHGRRAMPGQGRLAPFFFWIFPFFWSFLLHFGQFFIGSLGNGPRLLGEWVHSTPILSNYAHSSTTTCMFLPL
jgi:hypothetical protein